MAKAKAKKEVVVEVKKAPKAKSNLEHDTSNNTLKNVSINLAQAKFKRQSIMSSLSKKK